MQEDNNPGQVRRLKVYPKYVSRAVFPEIRLCGKWLQETGFHDGQMIIVRHEKNRIIIVPDDEGGEEQEAGAVPSRAG